MSLTYPQYHFLTKLLSEKVIPYSKVAGADKTVVKSLRKQNLIGGSVILETSEPLYVIYPLQAGIDMLKACNEELSKADLH